MHIASNAQGRDDDTDRQCVASGHILLGFLLAVVGSLGFIGGGVELGHASELQLASYHPTENFSDLSLKDSSAISARVPQETFASRYAVVSKQIVPTIPPRSTQRVPVSVAVVESLISQAACTTGGMYDRCPDFMDLLQIRQKALPRLVRAARPPAHARLTTASVSNITVVAANEKASLVAEHVIAMVDRLSMRAGEVIIGTASMYNPYDKDDNDAGGAETASSELYNPIAWTAAIQIDMREKFAGVRYGRLYRPSFALVQLNGKRAIVKINDVGPLRPGRVIDLSAQAMHYFDPTLERGVLDGMLVTPLVGSNWTPGPLGTKPPVAVASTFL